MWLKAVGPLREKIQGRNKNFIAGEVFDHPSDSRARRLLEITPPIVENAKEPKVKEEPKAEEPKPESGKKDKKKGGVISNLLGDKDK